MLRKIHIQNYALIDHLEIDFQKGLNIITGETGAGKSILLGALTLILGQRADTSVLKDKTKNCIIEGEFDVSDYDLEDFFASNDIEFDKTTIIRRQINDSGKSRAFINETPVNLNQLKELGDLLIDIHSQHENLLLSNSLFQLKVIDSFASLKNDVLAYRNKFNSYRELKQRLIKFEEDAQSATRDFDYLKHQLTELTSANLKADELVELEALQKQLTHASEIKESLQFTYDSLNNDTASVLAMLKDSIHSLKRISQFYQPAINIEQRIESCRIEIKDIVTEIDALNSKVDVDDELLDKVSKRIDLIYTLFQKHRVTSIDELILLRNSIEEKVNYISGLDFNLENLRKELKLAESDLMKVATDISKKRKSSIPQVEKSVTDLLVQLGILHAAFKIDIQQLQDFQSWGIDKITFFFTANKQVAPMELSRVASGGELSRLMLSLKSLLVKSSGLPTIIFDEIDTGVSGEIADKMGTIIHEMANGMQVINITHLPQIAAKGKTHFLVYKDNLSAQSATRIKLLSPDERVIEIAKMLSGEKLTDAALSNAKELLS
ncbi:MAG TPA: DNA repair protein RecN [Tenuifilaceae bacterium]|nr:DNA repair protein RecN [Tenuifilaceae bacterium]HOZ15567.1 DNA repair protein RecN [Tenuifilaceae bacterium]HPN22380.1 DNA repair protein RecN [Tenuifilaceae bacterium]